MRLRERGWARPCGDGGRSGAVRRTWPGRTRDGGAELCRGIPGRSWFGGAESGAVGDVLNGHGGSPGQWCQRRASSGRQMPHGKVAGESRGLAAVQPLQPDLRDIGRGLGVGDRAGQVRGVGDGHRDVQPQQADPGAAGLLIGRLPGPGMVVHLAGSDIAAGAAAVLLAELRRPHLAVQCRSRRRGGQRPVLQADPLGEGARAKEAGEHVGGDVLAGGFPPGPAHRGAAVVPVAVPVFFGLGRASAGPVELLLQAGADPGGKQAADLPAHRWVERDPHHARDVDGAGPAQHGHPARAQRRFQARPAPARPRSPQRRCRGAGRERLLDRR